MELVGDLLANYNPSLNNSHGFVNYYCFKYNSMKKFIEVKGDPDLETAWVFDAESLDDGKTIKGKCTVLSGDKDYPGLSFTRTKVDVFEEDEILEFDTKEELKERILNYVSEVIDEI